MIGTQLGHYRIDARLGAGGMGVVYRAYDTRLERHVAVKVFAALGADPKARQRLLHEARSASALNHPHICTVYEVGESDAATYLVMEYVDGQTLGALIPPEGLPSQTAVTYAMQIASALAHAHSRGVVHRDLKSANVVVTADGQAKVLDFGLALRQMTAGANDAETRAAQMDSMLAPGQVVGTLAYMAPEAFRGALVDARADIWALGVVLYEMVAAGMPFHGETTFEVSGQVLHGVPAPLPGRVPPRLSAIIARCLSKDPHARYANVSEVMAALETVHAQRPGETAAAADRPGLLVLPFTNLAADAESDYFADGLSEELIADLSNVRHLRVISGTSSRQFKGSDRSVTDLAKQFNVGYVLEGSVRRSGPALRITAKLIEVAADSPVFGRKYDGVIDDVFAFQERISRSIVEALRVALTPEEAKRLAERPMADAHAYEWYLRAKQESLQFTKEGLDSAIACLDRAEAIVGENVLVLAAKGEAYWQFINAGISADVAYLDNAEACAQRILELAPDSPHGHRVAGLVRVHRGDMQGGLRQLKQALDADPNDPGSLLWGTLVAGMSGCAALAEAWSARLVEVDPVTPFHQAMPGTAAWMRGDFALARVRYAQHEAAVLENPILSLAYGLILAATGRLAEADLMLEALARSDPHNTFSQLADVYRYAFAGRRDAVIEGLTPALVEALASDPQVPVGSSPRSTRSSATSTAASAGPRRRSRAGSSTTTCWRTPTPSSPLFAAMRASPPSCARPRSGCRHSTSDARAS